MRHCHIAPVLGMKNMSENQIIIIQKYLPIGVYNNVKLVWQLTIRETWAINYQPISCHDRIRFTCDYRSSQRSWAMRWLLFYFLGVIKHIQTRISSCENSKPSVINWKYLTNFNNSMECLKNIGLLNRILITRGPWLSQIISISDFTLPWLRGW